MSRAPSAGLVLAGGAGRRWRGGDAGVRPKALLADETGTTLLATAIRALTGAGCDPVVVVVGSDGDLVRAEVEAVAGRQGAPSADAPRPGTDRVGGRAFPPTGRSTSTASSPPTVRAVACPTWSRGMGESLRTGIAALADAAPEVACAVVTLADLPDQGPAAVRRLLDRVGGERDALARATYGGRPGHPVLLGRAHWAQAAATAHDDVGARDLLARPEAVAVDCTDLSSGRDVDRPDDLAAAPRRWGPVGDPR